MTAAAFQSLEISDNKKERLNRLEIGVVTILSNHFRREGPDCLVLLICRGPDVDQGRGGQVESKASCRKMLIEILNYRGFIGGDSVS